MALRLLIYDRTCARGGIGLSTCWSAGSRLYGALGRLDESFGAATWDEALGWAAGVQKNEPIGEIQYWGHGTWGGLLLDRQLLDVAAFDEKNAQNAHLRALRERLTPDAQLWFRTCETFGAARGIDFARRCTDFFGVRAAGHTRVIGYWQSGLRGLLPGHVPDWSAAEGVAEGSPDAPKRAHGSGPFMPRTITCTQGRVPSAWFS